MMVLKTIDDINLEKYLDEKKFDYQEKLTQNLDAIDQSFDQDIVNQIVLWKVNRYAQIDVSTFGMLNRISRHDTKFDEGLTRELVQKLIDIKGIRLPMASTILRFKNPNIYQIIDQRVYRVLYDKTYNLSTNKTQQVDLYLKYLHDLKKKCSEKNIPFNRADRILYLADKAENKDNSIKY